LRIRVYSDIHLEHAPFAPPDGDADVVVLAGDIGNGTAGIEWARGLPRPVLVAEITSITKGDLPDAPRCSGDGGAVTLLDGAQLVVDKRFSAAPCDGLLLHLRTSARRSSKGRAQPRLPLIRAVRAAPEAVIDLCAVERAARQPRRPHR
jgi:hypothetical protein